MANKHSVVDHGDLRKYFAAIPNIVFKLGLNPYELALYAHFKQAAGDDGGVCWKSRATIAKEAGMSSGMVTKARQSLEAVRPELDGRPLITVLEEASKSGGKTTCRVSITDIWALNMSKYSTSPHDVDSLAPSPHDQRRHTVTEQRHHTTTSTSPHDHKEELLEEEPIKKNPEEGERDFISTLKTNSAYSHIDLDREVHKMEAWLSLPTNKGRKFTPRFVLNWLNKIERPLTVNGNGSRAPVRYVLNDAKEVCLRCHNTGTETTPHGSRYCDHLERV